MTKINAEKLASLIDEMSAEIVGYVASTSAFIGVVNGKPVRLEVMSPDEADEEHGFSEVREHHRCVE